jgi:hypothetical protein
MANLSYKTTLSQFPQFANVVYNPDTDTFTDSVTGETYDTESLDEASKNDRIQSALRKGPGGDAGAEGVGYEIPTGGRTLARAIVIKSARAAASERRPGLFHAGRDPKLLRRTFYSRGAVAGRFGGMGESRVSAAARSVGRRIHEIALPLASNIRQ